MSRPADLLYVLDLLIFTMIGLIIVLMIVHFSQVAWFTFMAWRARRRERSVWWQ